jgi:hypothetical protein
MVSASQRMEVLGQVLGEMHRICEDPKTQSIPAIFERWCYYARGCTVKMVTAADDEGPTLLEIGQIGVATDSFWLYPYFEEDEKIHPSIPLRFLGADANNVAIYGAYVRACNTITLRMEAETPKRLAYCLLHEIGHAIDALKRHLIGSDIVDSDEMRHEEELRIRNEDIQLLNRLGDATYRNAVDDMALKLRRFHLKNGKVPKVDGAGKALEYLYGAPASATLANLRDQDFINLCDFVAADKYLRTEVAHQEKLKMIRHMYRKRS